MTNPQPVAQPPTKQPVHRLYNTWRRVAHFSRLLRQAMGCDGAILIPGQHTGMQGRLQLQNIDSIYVHLFFKADRRDGINSYKIPV